MDKQKLTELLHLQETEIASATPFCPDSHEIAAFLEGNLDRTKSKLTERHLANCSYCRACAVVLVRFYEPEDELEIPDSLLVLADQFGDQKQRKRIRLTPTWASAAVLVLALSAIILLGPRSGFIPLNSDTVVSSVTVEPRQLRSIDPASRTPTIVSPVDGDRINPRDLTIRWTETQGSLHYDVRVVNAEGFIVLNDRIEGATEWKPPVNHLLEPGMSYFVRVDAYLAEAHSVSSEHILFTIGENQE
jgi:hypothetical protein